MSPHPAITRAFTRQSFVRSGRSRARSSSVPRASRVSRAPSARLPYPRNLQSFVHARLARSPESPRAFLARAPVRSRAPRMLPLDANKEANMTTASNELEGQLLIEQLKDNAQ